MCDRDACTGREYLSLGWVVCLYEATSPDAQQITEPLFVMLVRKGDYFTTRTVTFSHGSGPREDPAGPSVPFFLRVPNGDNSCDNDQILSLVSCHCQSLAMSEKNYYA